MKRFKIKFFFLYLSIAFVFLFFSFHYNKGFLMLALSFAFQSIGSFFWALNENKDRTSFKEMAVMDHVSSSKDLKNKDKEAWFGQIAQQTFQQDKPHEMKSQAKMFVFGIIALCVGFFLGLGSFSYGFSFGIIYIASMIAGSFLMIKSIEANQHEHV